MKKPFDPFTATVPLFCWLLVLSSSTVSAEERLATLELNAWKRLLCNAASVSKDDASDITDGKIKTLDDFRTKSLTAFFLADRPFPGQRADHFKEFRLGPPNSQIKTARIWSALQLTDGGFSFLRSDHIQEIKGELRDGEVTGCVKFEAIDPVDREMVFSGRVTFKAQQSNGAWTITEFDLPVRKVRFTRGGTKWVSKSF